MKPLQLLSVLPRRPSEFMDRVWMIAESRWEAALRRRPSYASAGKEEAFTKISGSSLGDLSNYLAEPAFSEISTRVQSKILDLPADAPFASFHHGDPLLAQACYAVSRALRPAVAVETGVCYGVTSAHILRALEANRRGHLHSVDLPPLGRDGDDYVGRFIPEELSGRWTLHRGCSRKLLEPLLCDLGSIDLFIHDSLHTYRNMKQEFALAWSALRPGGALISDDIDRNSAFLELARFPDVSFFTVVTEVGKNALLGLALKSQ